MKTLKAGDSVFVVRVYGWNSVEYTKGIVAKLTPSGMIDILVGHSVQPTRFNTDGRERTSSSYGYSIDDKDFAEREVLIEQEKRAETAAKAISEIRAGEDRVRASWGKDGLRTELERIEKLVATARVAVDAI